MKKSLFTLLFLVFLLPAFSQITLTTATHGFINGDRLSYLFGDLLGDTLGFSPGTGGASKTWDFNSLSAPTITLHGLFKIPSATPYGATFSSATTALFDSLSIFDSTFSYSYFKVSSSACSLTGIGDSDLLMVYDNDEILLPFPMTYSTLKIDTFSATANDTLNGLKVIRNGTNKVIGDGWGILKIMGKTFSNVLRVKSVEVTTDYYIDSEFGDTFDIEHYYTEKYQWYASSFKSPVFQFTFKTNTSDLDSGFVDSSRTFIVNQVALNSLKDEEHASHIRVYPNPCREDLHIDLNSLKPLPCHICLYTINGKLVKSAEPSTASGNENMTIDLQGLPTGIYTLKITSPDGTMIKKIIKY